MEDQAWHDYNSALIVGTDGARVGRYDKIHLVPFGEYIPFKNLLVFARKLTGRVSEFTRGDERKVFRLNGHRYGVFICYEAVFADEVRQFAQLGAEVLVNISDDGWYGDTSAPWQHLNMALSLIHILAVRLPSRIQTWWHGLNRLRRLWSVTRVCSGR